MITSDFESQSHEQLRAMIESADPAATRALGDRLKTAGVAIGKIGEDLRTYMSHVNWEGEAGDAFRTWGANMVNATTRLGEFSDKAGTWMGHAAETLSTVKSAMPEYSATSKATLNSYLSQHPGGFLLKPAVNSDAPKPGGGVLAGPTPEAATAAQKRLDEDHAEAVRLMRQLAGSYVWSAHNMGEVERPQFQPIRPDHMPRPDIHESEYIPGPGAAQDSAPAVGVVSAGDGVREGGVASAAHAPGVSTNGSGTNMVTGSGLVVQPEASSASMDVDGGVAVPTVPASSSDGIVVPSRTEGAPDRVQLPSTPGVPPVGHVKPAMPTGRSEAHASTVPGLPGQSAAGKANTGQETIGRLPLGPGVAGGRGNVPAPGAPNDGIIGGRPVARPPAQSSAQGIRGTVIGTEPVHGRLPVGHGLGGPLPGVPAGSPGRAGRSGRRLASESGGIVGAQAQARPGAVDRPFTQGGTGLVRNPDQANSSRGGPRRGQREGRPDYLIEDDGTWLQGNRRVVPPVID
ncbi:WXG100 family type VII secretion target [Streptomyces syringium]|uniref:WXG100 family type VII secretion target n=1 Tax=Streptomyces syringium TaxID=76729 RepID=UPI0033C09F67